MKDDNMGKFYPAVEIDGQGIRLACELILERKLGSPIKPGFRALHSCGNPQCLAEDHLLEVTEEEYQRSGMQDLCWVLVNFGCDA